MNRFTPKTWGNILLVAIICLALSMMYLHNLSLDKQLAYQGLEITKLKHQLEVANSQRCNQSYDWQGNSSYEARIESSGGWRNYNIHTPSGYVADSQYPVIVVFDGLDGTAERAQLESGFDETPAFIVYPQALVGSQGATAWQGAPYSPVGVNDVQFINDMLTQVSKDFCVDDKAVYLVGMSNGASFAFLAACQLDNKISGVAGISGAYYKMCQPDKLPSRVIFIHSLEDRLVPYGGSSRRGLPPVYAIARQQGRKVDCQQLTSSGGDATRRLSWRRCNDDRRLDLFIVHHQPHGWLQVTDESLVPAGSPFQRTTSQVIWDFFTAK